MESSSEQARFNMIEQQIRPWDVFDRRVLDTMSRMPREAFVPDAYVGLAYADFEVPIGNGQSMMAPGIVARMLQALNVQPGDKVLEIGAGTGYTTACLADLGGKVISREIDATLAETARLNIDRQGLRNVEVRGGDALEQAHAEAPFDVIAVTGSLPSDQPLALLQEQLARGGRLFVVIGEAPVMEALLITRTGERHFRRESMFETSLPALANVPEPERFSF